MGVLYDRSQLNKGLLEGCILKVIAQKSTYGYNIISILTEAGFSNIKESTLYPLLVRLEKKELITSFYEPSALGPARKYYQVTPGGTDYLNEFITAWKETQSFVDEILEWRSDYDS